MEEPTRRLAESKGIGANVVFAGFREDVPRLLRTADLFVLSSFFEGLPIALLEAMALAKPVVVTSAGGIPEVVRDGREGFVVPPGEPVELAKRIIEILSDDVQRASFGAAAQARAADFDIRKAVATMESVYEEVTPE